MTKKLLIVDDHEIIRLGLRLMLENTDLEVSAEATTAAEALAEVEKSIPDVVLMDIRMEGGDGLNALGVTPRDMMTILQAIKAAGALQADIEVR